MFTGREQELPVPALDPSVFAQLRHAKREDCPTFVRGTTRPTQFELLDSDHGSGERNKEAMFAQRFKQKRLAIEIESDTFVDGLGRQGQLELLLASLELEQCSILILDIGNPGLEKRPVDRGSRGLVTFFDRNHHRNHAKAARDVEFLLFAGSKVRLGDDRVNDRFQGWFVTVRRDTDAGYTIASKAITVGDAVAFFILERNFHDLVLQDIGGQSQWETIERSW